jgi:hypothetical protein
MANWAYRCYIDGKSPNLWRRWYDAHPDCQGSHDSVFRILDTLTPWREPQAKKLSSGVIEVRLSGTLEWRVFGFYGTKQKEFVVVSIASKKGAVYTPKDALKTAEKLMKLCQADSGKAGHCECPK